MPALVEADVVEQVFDFEGDVDVLDEQRRAGLELDGGEIEDALDAGDLFVLESDGVVAAAAKINQIQVPEYANAQWRYPDAPEGEIMVLHTLVVEPAQAGRGYGSAFVQFYEDYAREYGCSYLRMDTNAKNQAARKLYAHLGYWESGIVDCNFNGIPGVALVCLEKKLNL